MNAVTILLDNGSLAPASTLRLRKLATELERRIGQRVRPVSLLHSSAIAASELEGESAHILEPTLARLLGRGERRFVVLPLFFGPSRALTGYLPERLAQLRQKHGEFQATVAPALFQADDDRIARIVADNVRSVANGSALRVALVDHGSPVREVTEVRDTLAGQTAAILGPGATVVACSMERREGPEYDFNEPLLETLLAREGWSDGEVIVAMQFLLPGRHAGCDGDVAAICQRAQTGAPGLRTSITPLVGDHPMLLSVLADRWQAAMSGR